MKAQPLSEGFVPYVWASSSEEIARRHGLRPERVIRYDQNTPALPGVPQIPLGESFRALNDYPDGTYRELREAAAAYAGQHWLNVVVGAGADDLIALCARTFLGTGSSAAIATPTYPLFRIATQLQNAAAYELELGPAPGAAEELLDSLPDVDLVWWCNPNNPTGGSVEPERLAALACARPDTVVVVDEAYVEYGAGTAAPFVGEQPNLVVIRTLSKAFGFAALRVGFALAEKETAGVLEARRAPAPIATPAARIAAAALRKPPFDVRPTIAERERMRSLLLAAGYVVPPSSGNFVFVRTEAPLADGLEKRGLVVRAVPGGIRITVRNPEDDDLLLRALGVAGEAC
jgi:histidinol-phosphate aminotransferase